MPPPVAATTVPASTQPLPGPARTAADMAAIARQLFPRPRSVKTLLQRSRPRICPFHEVIRFVPAGSTLLDVGCGCGVFLGILAREGAARSAVGFDSSAGAIAAAKQMAEQANLKQLDFQLKAVQDPWPDGLFDVVTIIDVLHHIPPEAHGTVVRMAAEHVRPGGRLIVKDMAPELKFRAFANRMHDLLVARQWVRFASADQIAEWGTGAGLRLVHRARIVMLWYAHDLLVFERPSASSEPRA